MREREKGETLRREKERGKRRKKEERKEERRKKKEERGKKRGKRKEKKEKKKEQTFSNFNNRVLKLFSNLIRAIQSHIQNGVLREKDE